MLRPAGARAEGGRRVRDGGVKRATAVRQVREMAEEASGLVRFRETEIGWPLEELWAAGDLLGDRETIEAGTVVLMVDVPPEELPWLAVHPVGESVGERLGLGKRPFQWFYRPMLWPAWNPAHQRVAQGSLDSPATKRRRALPGAPAGGRSDRQRAQRRR
jgi:hypothetical protein